MIDRDVMQLAFCWTIERRDGAGLALTSHDEMLSIDGVRFEPGAGLTPKALRFDGSGDTGESAVTGAVTSALLDEMSLLAGHWDGARVRLFMVDWSDPEGEQVELLAGELGQVDKVGEEFEVALLTAFAKLDAPACPETTPLCRAELGDRKCRIDLATRQRRARVLSAQGATLTIDGADAAGMIFGSVTILDGENRGQRFTVLRAVEGVLTLREVPRWPIEPGTRLWLVEGCDKTFATCTSRFDNARNFRGEPHLPGTDLLTRYPGA